MKKSLISLLALVAVICGAYVFQSCSQSDSEWGEELTVQNGDPTVTNGDAQAHQELLSQLQAINNSVLANQVETKGVKNFFKNHKITIADIAGGIVGFALSDNLLTSLYVASLASDVAAHPSHWFSLTKAVGSSSSILATSNFKVSPIQNQLAVAVHKVNTEDNFVVLSSDYEIALPERYKDIATDVAEKHNLILAILREDEYDPEDLNKLTEEEYATLYSEEFTDIVNYTMPYFAEMDYSFMDSTSIEYQVLEKFEDVYTQSLDEIDDLIQLINRYIEVIEADTTIEENKKEAIYIGLAVAAYSHTYWEKVEVDDVTNVTME